MPEPPEAPDRIWAAPRVGPSDRVLGWDDGHWSRKQRPLNKHDTPSRLAADQMLEALKGLEELFAIREGSEVMQPLCTIEKDRVASARAAIAAAQGEET